MPRIALVAAKGTADLLGDGPLLLAAFDALGLDAEVVGWGGETGWHLFDAVLVRGTWDYVFDRQAFLAWASEVSAVSRLANSLEVLAWNTDKRYLRDLESAGVPTVPTVWVEPGDRPSEPPWDQYVVKPSVSAGARLAARYGRDDDPADHVRRIHATGAAAMLQPYLTSIDAEGEAGTYVFGGQPSHAIRKGAVLHAGRTPVDDLSGGEFQPVEAAALEPRLVDFAQQVLEAAPPLLYARVDTATDGDGEPLLLELEATEPFLFLEHAPEAAHRFASAVARWLQTPPQGSRGEPTGGDREPPARGC